MVGDRGLAAFAHCVRSGRAPGPPVEVAAPIGRDSVRFRRASPLVLITGENLGDRGLEPLTFSMSRKRSNQLS